MPSVTMDGAEGSAADRAETGVLNGGGIGVVVGRLFTSKARTELADDGSTKPILIGTLPTAGSIGSGGDGGRPIRSVCAVPRHVASGLSDL